MHDGCPALVLGDRRPVQFEFEAEQPVCPECNASGTLVVELVPVHYLIPAPAGPIRTGSGRRQVACSPMLAVLPHSTSERGSVTCSACKASQVFADHEARAVQNHLPIVEKKIAVEQGVKAVVQA